MTQDPVSAYNNPSMIQEQFEGARQQSQTMRVLIDKAERDYLNGQKHTIEELQILDQISQQVRGHGFAKQKSGGGIGQALLGAADEIAFGSLSGLNIIDKPDTIAGANARGIGEAVGFGASLLGGYGAAKLVGKGGSLIGRSALKTMAKRNIAAAAPNASAITKGVAGARNVVTANRRAMGVGAGYGAVTGLFDSTSDGQGGFNSAGEMALGAAGGAGLGVGAGLLLGGGTLLAKSLGKAKNKTKLLNAHRARIRSSSVADEAAEAAPAAPSSPFKDPAGVDKAVNELSTQTELMKRRARLFEEWANGPRTDSFDQYAAARGASLGKKAEKAVKEATDAVAAAPAPAPVRQKKLTKQQIADQEEMWLNQTEGITHKYPPAPAVNPDGPKNIPPVKDDLLKFMNAEPKSKRMKVRQDWVREETANGTKPLSKAARKRDQSFLKLSKALDENDKIPDMLKEDIINQVMAAPKGSRVKIMEKYRLEVKAGKHNVFVDERPLFTDDILDDLEEGGAMGIVDLN